MELFKKKANQGSMPKNLISDKKISTEIEVK